MASWASCSAWQMRRWVGGAVGSRAAPGRGAGRPGGWVGGWALEVQGGPDEQGRPGGRLWQWRSWPGCRSQLWPGLADTAPSHTFPVYTAMPQAHAHHMHASKSIRRALTAVTSRMASAVGRHHGRSEGAVEPEVSNTSSGSTPGGATPEPPQVVVVGRPAANGTCAGASRVAAVGSTKGGAKEGSNKSGREHVSVDFVPITLVCRDLRCVGGCLVFLCGCEVAGGCL